jgi:hypothetical protein
MEESLVALVVMSLMVWRVVYDIRRGLQRRNGPY